MIRVSQISPIFSTFVRKYKKMRFSFRTGIEISAKIRPFYFIKSTPYIVNYKTR